jgi:hypothetical protein
MIRRVYYTEDGTPAGKCNERTSSINLPCALKTLTALPVLSPSL